MPRLQCARPGQAPHRAVHRRQGLRHPFAGDRLLLQRDHRLAAPRAKRSDPRWRDDHQDHVLDPGLRPARRGAAHLGLRRDGAQRQGQPRRLAVAAVFRARQPELPFRVPDRPVRRVVLPELPRPDDGRRHDLLRPQQPHRPRSGDLCGDRPDEPPGRRRPSRRPAHAAGDGLPARSTEAVDRPHLPAARPAPVARQFGHAGHARGPVAGAGVSEPHAGSSRCPWT